MSADEFAYNLAEYLKKEIAALEKELDDSQADGWGDSDSRLVRCNTLKEILDKISPDSR